MRRPELVLAELARVARPGGRVLVTISSRRSTPSTPSSIDRFERARDPSHHRALSDVDLRDLFAMNGLMLVRSERFTHRRELDFYLGLAGCTGADAERVKDLSPGDRDHYVVESAWYLCEKR